jgi:hypothetical protein
VKMFNSRMLESSKERREVLPFPWNYKMRVLPQSKDIPEENEFPLGLAVGILSNRKKEDNNESPANHLKRKVKQFLEEENISGIVFNMSVPSSSVPDVKQIIMFSNIVIVSDIIQDRHADEISELQTWQPSCLGKKLAIVSTDQTENSRTKSLREDVDFLIKFPFDYGEVCKMMEMFTSSIKKTCRGVFPMGRKALHD